jgi:FkbM family methyltransferase
MKKIIKALLKNAGFQLQRINYNQDNQFFNRSSMKEGLNWLSSHHFHISTVLDIGASNGMWSKECMNFFPKANYVLFEPLPFHSEALDSFAKSSKQTVIPIKKAVGASEGHTFFYGSTPFGGAIARNDEGNNTIKVELTTIKSSISQLNIEGPYLLKLDTHGYEKDILTGAGNILDKTEILIIEAYNHKFNDEAFYFWELCTFLSDRGFRPVDLVDLLYRPKDNSIWQMDLIFVRSTWEGFNDLSYE